MEVCCVAALQLCLHPLSLWIPACSCNNGEKGSSLLVEISPSPAVQGCSKCVLCKQGHQSASSPSAWLLLLSPALSHSVFLPPFPFSLPPSLLLLSLAQYSTDTAPPPSQPHHPHQVFIQKNTLYLARRPDYAHTDRKEAEGAAAGGRRRREAEGWRLRQTCCMNVSYCGRFVPRQYIHACRPSEDQTVQIVKSTDSFASIVSHTGKSPHLQCDVMQLNYLLFFCFFQLSQ